MNEPAFIRAHAGQPPIAILGVPFDNLTPTEVAEFIQRMVVSRRPHHLIVADVNLLMESQRDPELRRVLFEANLVLCEGSPLVRASRWLGDASPERVLGADLLPLLFRVVCEQQYRVFLLADSSEKAAQAVVRLKQKYPQVVLVGSGILGNKILGPADVALGTVRDARPDVILVAIGCDGVEKWVSANYQAMGAPVCVGVGDAGCLLTEGALNKSSGISWRGARNWWSFALGVLQQWWQLQFRSPKLPAQVSTPMAAAETWQCIKLPPRLDFQATRDDALLVDQVLADGRHCLLDLAAVDFIDSTGVGLLIRLQRKVRASGKQLVLLAPSAKVQRALKLMQLHSHFAAAPDLAAAREYIQQR